MEHRLGEERAHPDDEEDVEDGRADDGADADVWEGDEDTDDGGEELGSWASGRHEGGSGDVLGAADDLDDDVEGWDEELVADDGQRDEHVHHAEHVEDDTTLKHNTFISIETQYSIFSDLPSGCQSVNFRLTKLFRENEVANLGRDSLLQVSRFGQITELEKCRYDKLTNTILRQCGESYVATLSFSPNFLSLLGVVNGVAHCN